MNLEPVKGFKDYTGKQALIRSKIKEIIENKFKLYGFQPAETPVIEYESFITANNPSDEAVSDTYKLTDKGKRKLALRYEFTFQLKRLAKNKKLPYRRYQLGPVVRDEPTSSNRFRQFTQADVDVVGSSIKDEAEILALASAIFKKLGIKITILINNRKLLNEILEQEKIKNKLDVIKELDKLDKLPENQVRANLKKYKAEKLLSLFKKPETWFKKFSAYSEIQELEKYCKFYNIKVNFQPNLARGLSYYTGSIFEIKSTKLKETIAAGGSYLVNGIQSTGISFGLERLSNLAKVNIDKPDYLIISINQDSASIKLAEKLRKAGKTCFILDKISKALEYANSNNIPQVIFLGEKEAKKNKIKIRDMKTGKEKLINKRELLNI